MPRPVTVLACGGTIAMSGTHAVPALAARELVAAAMGGGPGPRDLELEDLMNLPGPQLTGADALTAARRALQLTDQGRGVVVTCGTDTMEELAVLADVMHAGEEPIVFTGANRPASKPGADGPANLADAVVVAGATSAAGRGVLLVFGGEVHAAATVTKVDTSGPSAFGSPQAGPLGRLADGGLWWARGPGPGRPGRPWAPLKPAHMDARVEIVTAHLGADGEVVRSVSEGADGLVAVLLGAGHAPPKFAEALAAVSAHIPVVLTSRVMRGGLLHDTYGFAGSERDLRAAPAIPAGLLTPAAARIKLVAGLGTGLDRAGLGELFAGDDTVRPEL